jgi:D-arabinose 1-dehydrogenase-like Zn-dependent alcohol dehydrogenase
MGNDEEFAEMLTFINEHKIIPIVDAVFELTQAEEAIEKMSDGKQFGKIVLKVS